ncbi:hypothetical protein [Salinisphaera sp. G21_0]|nr:hypothetical protein [Salinisphaera sp. G21_0]MBO9484195.1 hypothetical protein [Salinisphaera sp. G21_0]
MNTPSDINRVTERLCSDHSGINGRFAVTMINGIGIVRILATTGNIYRHC